MPELPHYPHELAFMDVSLNEVAFEGPEVGQLLVGANFL
jgi:hypothetical protein